MEEVRCGTCVQPLQNCGRSDRRSVSFRIEMTLGFMNGAGVSCKNKLQLDKLVPGEWMVAATRWNHKFDMYLMRKWGRTIISGPYWRSLVRMFHIQLGDVVYFQLVDEKEVMEEEEGEPAEEQLDEEVQEEALNKFTITFFRVVDNIEQEKEMVSLPVVKSVQPYVRGALHKMYFSDIMDVTEKDMATILFGLCKVACIEPTRELEEGEFYQKTSDMKYFVHRINAQNEDVGGLLIPEAAFDGYSYPYNGISNLWKRGLGQAIQGEYHYWDGRLVFVQGINALMQGENIVRKTLVMVKIQPKTDAIRLELVEIMHLD